MPSHGIEKINLDIINFTKISSLLLKLWTEIWFKTNRGYPVFLTKSVNFDPGFLYKHFLSWSALSILKVRSISLKTKINEKKIEKKNHIIYLHAENIQ